MRIVKPSVEFIWGTEDALKTIERAGRTCYKSEAKITDVSAKEFVIRLIDNGHEAMIEHASMSYRVICDRGVSHEIVRHRLFSFAQESTRYVSYKDGIDVIQPPTVSNESFVSWMEGVCIAEKYYKAMIEAGEKPQIARSILPTCLKTEIVITGNFREWRHFFYLRCARDAHPQMQEIANMIKEDAAKRYGSIF